VDKPVVPLEYQEGAASARGRRATSKLRAFLREPLVHFLCLGALLFIIFGFVGRNVSLAPPPQKPQIIVAPDRVTQLINYFRIDFKREPTPADVQKIIDDYIREEVLCREAWAQGIDRDEPKIRLQLKQMMEGRLADTADLAAPTDAELQTFIDARPELFKRNGVVPPLEQIRNPATSALLAARRKQAIDSAYDKLKQQYSIVIVAAPTSGSATVEAPRP
jgi:hypothetical protein